MLRRQRGKENRYGRTEGRKKMGKKTRASKKKLDKLLENCAMIRRKEKLKNVKKEI